MPYIKNLFLKEGIKGLSVLLLFIAIQYFTPLVISKVFFFGLLIYLYKTQKDEFWIPIVFFMISAPGYLFYSRGLYHLPAIGLSVDRGIKYGELLSIIYFIKSVQRRVKIPLFYKKGILYIFLYTFVLWIIGFYYGISIMKVLFTIRYLIPFSLFWSLPMLLNTKEKVYAALNLIFIFSVFAFLMQLVDIARGTPFAVLLGESQIMFSGHEVKIGVGKAFDVNKGVVRTIYSVFFLTISFFTSAYLLVSNNHIFQRKYLIFVLAVTLFSVFLSATRGWIIAYALVLFGMYIIKPKQIKIFFSGLILFTVLTIFIPTVRLQITNVLERLTTLEALAEGDITAGGSLSRITDRGPRVMKKYAESPVLGYGYSLDYYEYVDGHVGNQSLLLNSGVVGYSIYLIFWIYFMYYVYKKGKLLDKSLWIWALGLLALLVIHSSSAQVFAYGYEVEKAMGLSFIFYLSAFFIREKQQIKNNKQITL